MNINSEIYQIKIVAHIFGAHALTFSFLNVLIIISGIVFLSIGILVLGYFHSLLYNAINGQAKIRLWPLIVLLEFHSFWLRVCFVDLKII